MALKEQSKEHYTTQRGRAAFACVYLTLAPVARLVASIKTGIVKQVLAVAKGEVRILVQPL